MPTQSLYIQDSLELSLFFLRIMKEHALFIQLSLTPKNRTIAVEMENLRKRFDTLLRRAVRMAKGYVSKAVMGSGELFTRMTLEAEQKSQKLTGVPIDTQLTEEEYNIGGGAMPPAAMQAEADQLNHSALSLTNELLKAKERLHQDVMACRVFTTMYPSQLEHLIREARHYITMLQNLLARDLTMNATELADEEAFWNANMGEHAQFIEGSLDPMEKMLKAAAEDFAVEFEALAAEANAARSMQQILPEVTMRSEEATENIRDFKMQGAQGILSCQVRSIINPLLADHVLREASHYLRMIREQVL